MGGTSSRTDPGALRIWHDELAVVSLIVEAGRSLVGALVEQTVAPTGQLAWTP